MLNRERLRSCRQHEEREREEVVIIAGGISQSLGGPLSESRLGAADPVD